MENNKRGYEYFKDYNKRSRVRISLNLNKDTDLDILEAIERADATNKQAAVKQLIRLAIEDEKILDSI